MPGVGGLSSGTAADNDDGEDDGDDDPEDEDIEDFETPGVSTDPPAAVTPSVAVAKKWKDLLKIPKVVSSTKASRFGPPIKRHLRKWADVECATDFAALRGEDCLHGPFEATRKKSPDLLKLAAFTAGASGAAAHASLTAATALEDVFSDLEEAFGQNQTWSDWLTSKKERLKSTVLSPLQDSASCCAAAYGYASWQVRQSVTKEADKSIQSVLRSKPPADGFYFGNPADAIHAQMSYAYMSSAVNAKPSATRARPAFQSRSYAPKKKLPPPPTSSSSTKTSGNASGRSLRGGKSGRK